MRDRPFDRPVNMKKCTIILPWLVLLLISITFLPGCVQQGGGVNSAQHVGTLRVGVSPNAPPLAFKRNGQLQGLEIDLATQLGTYLGKEVKFVQLNWDNLLPSLEQGKIDIIMSGMTMTPKRAYRIAFSKPYFRSGQILLVRRDQANRFSTGIFSLMGNKPEIGVIEGTTGDFFITKTINKPRLTRFNTSESAVKALVGGKVDAVVHDAPILCYYAAQNEENTTPILQMATKEFLAWGINKSNPDLLSKVNVFIEQQAANGTLKATTKRWIPYM